MNAEMKNGINLLMILVLFISCVQEKEDNNVLRRVEACMELFPDSALSLLSQIECPECMRGQQRADYALLLTQALDKNYLDNLQSDSLIMIAVEYYKQEGDKLKAGKAYFYYGKVMLLKERFSDAMQAYLEASSLLEETRDYKVQGMVWEYIGYLNSVQGLYENSIDNFKHSIRYYELASDRRRILYGYRNMARGYFSVHHNDSAGWYAEKGLVLSDTVSGMKASFLHLLGLIANNEKRYPQAIEYFSNAMEVCDNLNDKYRYSLSLGRVYSEVGQKKKAEDCFVSCINATNIFVSSGAYYYLADMHKKDGNYLKAFLYKEKSDSLLEVTRNAELQKQFPHPGRLLVVCGKGNNGGDGFVIARTAAKDDWNVTVFLAEDEPKTADAILNFERLHSLPVHICTDCSVLETQHFDAAVDALYGTGFHGELRPSGLAACGLMRRLHKSGAFVLAVDLPSGINTDTGEVAEGAAHADLTVTFDSYKPLHMAESSAPLCGKIVCADIGIRDEWHPEF